MAIVDVYIDETGDLKTPRDGRPFGYGFFALERNEAALALRSLIESEFGGGFHLKEIRGGPRRKIKAARKLVSLIPSTGFFHGGTLMFPNPDYGGEPLFHALAEPCEELRAEIDATPVRQNGLILPEDIPSVGRLRNNQRYQTLYPTAVIATSIILLRAPECPNPLDLHVNFGAIGLAEDHVKKVSLSLHDMYSRSRRVYRELMRRRTIDRSPEYITVHPHTPASEPLMYVADLLAGVGEHLLKDSKASEGLYEAARPLLDRIPINPANVLRPGVWLMEQGSIDKL